MTPDLYPLIAQLQRAYDSVAVPLRQAITAADVVREYEWGSRPAHLAALSSIGAGTLASHLRNFHEAHISQVFKLVAQTLGTHGMPLELTGSDDIRERAVGRDAITPPLICKDLLDSLLNRYAPTAGAMALAQCADAFVSAFRLQVDVAPVIRAGRVVLIVPMYLSGFRSHSGRKSYSNEESLVRAANVMAQVVGTLYPDAAGGLLRQAEQLRRLGRANDWEPVRDAYGQIGAVTLRAYQSKVEFLVPVALAAEVNLFIGEHATALRRDEAA